MVLVWDEHGLLTGVAPLFVEDVNARVVTLRFLGLGAFFGSHLLVRSTGAGETTDALTATIASLRPRPGVLSFEAIDVESEWPDALARAWPGRGAWVRARVPHRATAIRLGGTFEEWVQARRKDWRQDYRRRQRRFFEHGGTIRRASSADDVRLGLDALRRLHDARWSGPAGDRLSPVVERTLREAGEQLAPSDAFRLWTAELSGRIIGASVFAAAGGAVAFLVTAFDPQWGQFAPGQRTIVAGIEEGFRLGDRVMDLSFGEFPYKFRLANEVRWISSYEVFPRNHRYLLARAYAMPRHARETLDHGRVRLGVRTRLAEARSRVAGKMRPGWW